MTETTDRNFLGIPIEGDLYEGSTRTPQRPLEEFVPIIQAVLDDPGVEFFGWTQYTPYFNDGDVCEFSAHGVWAMSPDQYDEVRERVDTEDDVWDGGIRRLDEFDLDYGSRATEAFGEIVDREWVENPETGRSERTAGSYEGPDRARYDRLQELQHAIEGGEFEHILLDKFGDHAQIRICRDRIVIEEYSHD